MGFKVLHENQEQGSLNSQQKEEALRHPEYKIGDAKFIQYVGLLVLIYASKMISRKAPVQRY